MANKHAVYELHNPKTKEVLTAKRGSKALMMKLKESMGPPWQFRKERVDLRPVPRTRRGSRGKRKKPIL